MGACGEAEGSVVLDVSSACGGWGNLDRLGGEQRLGSSVAAGKRWEVQHMKCKADFGVSCWAWSLWGPMRSPSEAPSFSYEIIHCKLAVCIKALCSGVLGCSEWDAVWCCLVQFCPAICCELAAEESCQTVSESSCIICFLQLQLQIRLVKVLWRAFGVCLLGYFKALSCKQTFLHNLQNVEKQEGWCYRDLSLSPAWRCSLLPLSQQGTLPLRS